MDSKEQVLSDLEQIYQKWQELIAQLPRQQIGQPFLPSQWTLKDEMAHLWSWQQASVARIEAVLQNHAPTFPDWWVACGPDPNEDVDRTNAYLYAASIDKSWDEVYIDWQKQYRHYLELLRQVPEIDLLEVGRFKWMEPYALIASPRGSWDHHQEHYDSTMDWLRRHSFVFS